MRVEIDGLKIQLKEIENGSFGCYLWSSALVLTLFLHSNQSQFQNKRILELGAGVGLCGLYLAKLGAKVTLSDAGMFPQVLNNLKTVVDLNQVQNCIVKELTWGQFTNEAKIVLDVPYDYIIGSDLFYNSKDFESLIATVYYTLLKSPGCKFITAYQERISSRCIDVLLVRWNLKAKQLDFHGPIEIYEQLVKQIKIYNQNNIDCTQTWDNADLQSVFIIEFQLKC